MKTAQAVSEFLGLAREVASAMTLASQARTAEATASRSLLRPWSPRTFTTWRVALAGGMPNRSRSPCTTSVGTVTAFELRQAALRRLAGASGRLERERQAEDGAGAGRVRGAASDAGTERTTANDEWQAAELAGAKVLEDGDPGGVELWRARGRPAAGNAVRLLDQRDGNPLRLRRVRRCPDIRRVDSSGSPVAESERRARPLARGAGGRVPTRAAC